MRFLELLEHDPEQLKTMTQLSLVGAESVEQIMWLAMQGAVGPEVRKLHQNYYLATTTAMTVVLFEDANDLQPTSSIRAAEVIA